MSILIDKSTRLIVQGITGRDGLFHAKKMKEYGTNVVGGTSPGKGGTDVDGIPVFNTMYDAVEQTKANTSIIFVPARFAADAIMEAADAGIRIIVCIAEGIPTLDVIKAHQRYLRYALYNATKYVCLWDPAFAAYLAKKRGEGKHYNVALSHAAKKLVRLICALEKSQQSYRNAA